MKDAAHYPPVAFVGAGPGDPELLTVKAVARLNTADVILYDNLAAGPVLDHARPDALLLDVGKRAGRPSPSQAEVNLLLVTHAKAGGRVVRLKSGDPGLFGRLEEEIEALRNAGIAFEIVPGINAASAAAAAAGIPLTRRVQARRVQFVTGHDETGHLPNQLNLDALADPGALTAVFMPKRTFAALTARLIAHGLSERTPVLLAENISRPDQRFVRSTIGALAADDEALSTQSPALILYGALAQGEGGQDLAANSKKAR